MVESWVGSLLGSLVESLVESWVGSLVESWVAMIQSVAFMGGEHYLEDVICYWMMDILLRAKLTASMTID